MTQDAVDGMETV